MTLSSIATRAARLIGNVALFLFFFFGGRSQSSYDTPETTETDSAVNDVEFARRCYFNEWSSEKE